MKKLLSSAIGFLLLLLSCDNNTNIIQDYNRGNDLPPRKNFSEKDLKYQGQTLKLTKHGICRMDCRKLDAYEVQEVICKGRVNKRKSNPNSKPCPTIVYEGKTSDGQSARVVVGTCENDVKIVTVIDLGKNWDCACR